MTRSPSTPIAPPEQRAGTYERDDDVTGLLRYGTHRILEVPRNRDEMTAGTGCDRDLILDGDGISAHHFVLRRRSRGLFVSDDASTNGVAREVTRNFGLALKPSFEDQLDGDGFIVVPGMTFVVGASPHRFIALDDAMREQHPKLVEILGTEEEVRTATEGGETPAPSDLILAAAGPGHFLITGQPGCDQEELARIIHKISKRRRQPPVEIDHVPDDRRGQSALLKQKAAKGTLVLHLSAERKPLDQAFVSSMFSLAYNIRVIVIARTPNQARRALSHQYWRPMMHVALCPVAMRRAAIVRLLDEWLVASGSVLRVSDLTPSNQRALVHNPWRDNLEALRKAAVRLDAIVRGEFSRGKAADSLGMKRQTFYHWFNNTMRLSKPLVTEARKHALLMAMAART